MPATIRTVLNQMEMELKSPLDWTWFIFHELMCEDVRWWVLLLFVHKLFVIILMPCMTPPPHYHTMTPVDNPSPSCWHKTWRSHHISLSTLYLSSLSVSGHRLQLLLGLVLGRVQLENPPLSLREGHQPWKGPKKGPDSCLCFLIEGLPHSPRLTVESRVCSCSGPLWWWRTPVGSMCSPSIYCRHGCLNNLMYSRCIISLLHSTYVFSSRSPAEEKQQQFQKQKHFSDT